MRYCIFLFLVFSSALSGQSYLEINTAAHCLFDKSNLEEELFVFKTETTSMDALVENILGWGEKGTKNFSLIQCNVPDVVAVVDGDKRYLLWSQDFLAKADRVTAIALTAHEIGHHLNEHQLSPDNLAFEELEADYYMGFVLSRAAVPATKMQDFMSANLKKEPTIKERKQSALLGFQLSENRMKTKSLGWDEDNPALKDFQKRAFSFPQCYQEAEIDRRYFSTCATLGDVAKRIQKELKQKKYNSKSFMSVPHGFALITRLEQYQADGYALSDENRWRETPVPVHFDFSLNYFRSLVFSKKCYLRVFVFVVTSKDFGPDTQHQVSKDEASNWLNQSINGLPDAIASEAFSQQFKVTALVYEFQVPDTNFKPSQTCPTHLTAETHLEKSGLFKNN